MKFRKGFVSNSSSTAFIVVFPCMAHTLPLRSVRELLFQGTESVGDEPFMWSAEEVAEIILAEMQKGPIDEIGACMLMSSGEFEGSPGWDNAWFELPRDEFLAKLEEYHRNKSRYITKAVKEWLKENEGYIYAFDFYDHDPLDAALGYGMAFRNLPHLRSNRR